MLITLQRFRVLVIGKSVNFYQVFSFSVPNWFIKSVEKINSIDTELAGKFSNFLQNYINSGNIVKILFRLEQTILIHEIIRQFFQHTYSSDSGYISIYGTPVELNNVKHLLSIYGTKKSFNKVKHLFLKIPKEPKNFWMCIKSKQGLI